ncbi:MAG TPA: polyprenyl synthetase family protein [Syntrophorhabdus sp.]|mgnify:FL=1|nr:polyprenyl synthetase family protein [Syntrophorhabdus sp.]OPX94905.1 MAG: Farnesyl diphosphate synthase [Syntrophorhabdus sp. PtaB.Bin027]OQB76143.1 MAG: Farnesyl diphosphate synthase [Deltaproteobacteria bacterium ADurb.Bin135]HOD78652.1 polyprenyl synthetase family protein [Syntrophorhabdus sp.]HPB38856.1 polyprenyl synthetase family protein [Syntrophorhabdus sp.]
MDLNKYLLDKKILIENSLKDIALSFHDCPSPLRDAMEYTLFSNGKRIRPILAITTCEAMGKSCDDILPFACAIEMIHSYSLIHDDLPTMDNDDMRRGKATCHKAFGEATALLAGDALLTEAFRVMSDNRYTERTNSRITKQLIFEISSAAGAMGMVGGQVMDVLSEGKEGTRDVLHYIHTHKTTALLRASVRVGAIFAGAKVRELKKLTKYGESVGLAFQIRDDLLDAEGEEMKVGKRLKKDSTKQTYMKHYGPIASKIRLEQLVEDAVQAVQFLGRDSIILAEIARFVGNRVA